MPGYHDIRMYPDAEQLPGLIVYRFDGPLFFANARTFRREIRAFAHADPPPRWIVIAAEPMTDVDTTAADMLEELDAGARGGRDQPRLRRDEGRRAPEHPRTTASTGSRDRDAFYPTVRSAVKAYRAATGVDAPD